ncbi:lectin subunit alpha-like [Calliphora vicina]|uniref:lectin subunit alpha-like n=1 Tax=Calliphora vicina TaxID=7373 RepID=UPI00325A9B12
MKSLQIWIRFSVIFLIQIEMFVMEPTWHESSDGKRFLIDMEEKYNWYQAWNECARYDAQLITIESQEKNQVLMKVLRSVNEKTKNMWIGGNVFYDKVFFHWAANEQEFTFTNWVSDGIDKFAAQKQCVYIMKHKKNFPWNIVNCDAKEFGFICEEVISSTESTNTESIKETEVNKGSMYNGSIYGLIG